MSREEESVVWARHLLLKCEPRFSRNGDHMDTRQRGEDTSSVTVTDELHFLNDCTRYDLLRQRLLDNPNVRDLCSDGTINNNYRPSDFLQLDKAQIHLAEYVYNCMSLRI